MVDDLAGISEQRVDLELLVDTLDHFGEVLGRERELLPDLFADGVLPLDLGA